MWEIYADQVWANLSKNCVFNRLEEKRSQVSEGSRVIKDMMSSCISYVPKIQSFSDQNTIICLPSISREVVRAIFEGLWLKLQGHSGTWTHEELRSIHLMLCL